MFLTKRLFSSPVHGCIALSLGLDRQEIIGTALLGMGEPWPTAPFEDVPTYHESYAKQFLAYDRFPARVLGCAREATIRYGIVDVADDKLESAGCQTLTVRSKPSLTILSG